MEYKPLIFGHRGCRGLMPENTIEGFKHALNFAIDGIEWDVVVNKNFELVVSHEELMDPIYCTHKNGNLIKTEHNLFKMSQAEILNFDCGMAIHKDFPYQTKIPTYKPLVQEVFDAIDFKDKTILFEIKSEEKNYGIKQPYPEEYVELILKEIETFKNKEQIILMCFDKLILELLYRLNSSLQLVYLHESFGKNAKEILNELTFTPYALGIESSFINAETVLFCKENNLKSFAWTVNTFKEANRLKALKIDAIITDFPNLFCPPIVD